MRGKAGVCALGLMALSASGCASGAFKHSSANMNHAPQVVARVFVVANVTTSALDDELYRGLESGLQTEFKECGIKSAVINYRSVGSLEVLQKARAGFKPDSVLVIRDEGGTIYRNVNTVGSRNELFFDLKLFNAGNDIAYWRGTSELKLATEHLFSHDIKAGKRFAQVIVERLRADGVIRKCEMLEEDVEEAARRAKENSGFNIND